MTTLNYSGKPMSRDHNLAILFLVLSLAFQILSLIFGKFASIQMKSFSPKGVVECLPYWASLLCLGLQALTWPIVLRKFPLFWAYLFMSGVLVAIPVVSWLVFHEPITRQNILGSVIIMVGITTLLTSPRGQTSG